MAALDLTSASDVLAYVTAQLPSEDTAVLELMLAESAGYKADNCDEAEGDEGLRTTYYRPWWVIANVLQSNVGAFQRLRSAAGSEVVYADRLTAIRAFMRRQRAFDQALCYVPEGFAATMPGGVGSVELRRSYGDG